jgi:hypothetical protein
MRPLRPIALMLALVLGLELTIPVGGYAQTQEPPSTQVASPANQELPPMQEAESIQERKPYYKKWWFWAIVGAVVAGAAAGAAVALSGSEPTPTGTLTITGPPPR